MRIATRFDKPAIKEMLRAFRDESGFTELASVEDSPHLDQLLESILIGQGVVFFEEGKGMLIALMQPSIWDNSIMILHELAWYVLPKYRRSSVGHRLFLAYMVHGNELKATGKIKYYTMGKLDSSPNLKYERYGFRKKDESWIK